jgi:N-acetylmuramoyl-L-alanine amidase
MSNSVYTWIFSPGHEGLSPHGFYLREGKQSPSVPPGIYEGVFNRTICNGVVEILRNSNVECVNLNPGPVNIPIDIRTAYANELYTHVENCRYVCVHANADGHGEWTDATGFRMFHYPGSSGGRYMAECFHDEFEARTAIRPRSIKANRFAELIKTDMPAVYIECGFMTNKTEASYLASTAGQADIIGAIASAVLKMEGIE